MRNKLLLLLTVVLSGWFFFGYGIKSGYFYGDELGYYLYLPATFIHHNLDQLEVLPADTSIRQSVREYCSNMRGEGWEGPRGKVVDQYTYGVALTELPFFAAAHLGLRLTAGNANGFSHTYEYALKVGELIYALLGLLLVYRLLRRHFSESVSAISVAILFLGTNLFWFALHQAGMAHVPLFFLYALLMTITVKARERPTALNFAATGFVAGLITLIRPSDVVCLLIPLLYSVADKATLKLQAAFLKANLPKLLPLAAAFVLPLLPQLLYWKALTGHYLYDSYRQQQTFNWMHPRIIAGLLEGKNGWLAYSPVMLLALAGLGFPKYFRAWRWCLWILLPVYIYIVYSWYCFNYINGFGSRPMIHVYSLLAFPLAAFLQLVSRKSLVLKMITAAGCLFFIALSISFSVQQSLGILDSEASHGYYNRRILFRSSIGYDDLVARDVGTRQPDPAKLEFIAGLGCMNCCPGGDPHTVKDSAAPRHCYYRMKDEETLPQPVKAVYTPPAGKGTIWFKISGVFLFTDWPGYYRHRMWLAFRHRGETELYMDKYCSVNNKIGIADNFCKHARAGLKLQHFELNRWGTAYAFIRAPKGLLPGDELTLDMVNTDRQELRISRFCLEAYYEH